MMTIEPPRDPKTPEEWQNAADAAAHCALSHELATEWTARLDRLLPVAEGEAADGLMSKSAATLSILTALVAKSRSLACSL